MKALVVEELGAPEIMRLREFEPRAPGEGEIRVGVRAAGLNFPDILMIAGRYQHKPPLPFVPGMEGAGEVLEVGPGVEGFRPGERVIVHARSGLYATEATLPAEWAVPLPADWSFAEGAAFWSAYATAFVSLVHRGRLTAGETLLVHGAAGGVGLAAVEFGHALGARVIAVVGGEEKAAAVRAKGADYVIDHRRESFRDRVLELTDGIGADVVYDPVGGEVLFQSLRCIAWGGRLLVVGFASGTIPDVPANYALLKSCSVIGVRAGEFSRRNRAKGREMIERLLALAAEGRIHPAVYRTLPLADAAKALALISDRQVIGKVVLEMTDD